MRKFVHLHVHSQYSILDGASSVGGLIKKSKEYEMPACALTDHGNMFGVKLFHKKAKDEGIKPILGCEAYVSRNSRFDRSDKDDRSGYHLILLAQDYEGYKNLTKLVSYSWTEGFYYKPRIDKELLRKYNKGIIASSACLGGEVPQAIMNLGYEEAERVIHEYQEIFGSNFFLEMQLHRSGNPKIDNDVYQNQLLVNRALFDLSVKTGAKCIATNDVHFIKNTDADAHDLLICLNTGKDLDDPDRMRYTKQEYFKSGDEMEKLFAEHPEVLDNTLEIADMVESYALNQKPIMPIFPIPQNFEGEMDYLRHITYEGAKKRWGDKFEGEIQKRVDFELDTIAGMGFPSYFLIVWDFIRAAREMGVSVGPGRGSAAGSAVAYSLRITDIDPIKYDLLFERFLNPDRISMPDIDIDFDEDGRERVLKWVVEKYGKKRVAHIITFGTMAAKMAIRDVARVLKLPLMEADKLSKLVPERPGTTLDAAYKEVPELNDAKQKGEPLVMDTLRFAEVLEGSVRQTGIHACGIIIGKNDLEEDIPLSTNKDSELFVTQYDGKHVEDVGLLKMDFLGLKTLSIIMDAIEYAKESKGVDIDIDAIPIDDAETFELFARGETTALFQFESPGMKKYLRALKPNRFEDLIAMNALYRPGPLEYIPDFVDRKNGRKKIEYDLPEMEEYLHDTYGITVYQEQVMLLSQKLAGFTKGQADSLRKAMGKKLKAMMDELKAKFLEGGAEKGHDKKILEKIWGDWEAFAQYAFNKSHSTCYAWIAYQTAYLKAHYPSEFMAAVLSRNLSDIKKITIFMDECKRMGKQVLTPDVNESAYKFTVNTEGNIRFGLGAIKGVGEAAVQCIVDSRKAGGKYKDIYDFVERVNLQSVNKKNLECLAMAGALDSFGFKRHQYFATDAKEVTFIENLVRYGSRMQSDKDNSQQSLFGGDLGFAAIARPEPPLAEEWSKLVLLNKEREMVGIYLSSHPMDDYRFELNHFCNTSLADLANVNELRNKELSFAGMVTGVRNAMTKTGKPYGSITIEDYTESYQLTLFGKDYENYRKYFYQGYTLLIKGRVEPRMYNDNEFEVRVKSMAMLHEVKSEMVKSLTLKVPLNNITQELVTELRAATDKHKGNVILKIKVIDPDEKMAIDFFSRGIRINLDNELLQFFEEMDLQIAVN
jgi:DNA polymerase-3 subunit alpha